MNLERGITLLILLIGLLLVTVGPLRSESEADWDCGALDQVDGERLDAILDEMIRDGGTLNEQALEHYGHGILPKEALPCLRERMEERMASGPRELSLRS